VPSCWLGSQVHCAVQLTRRWLTAGSATGTL
jgi:hypothetical protein